ncbi:phage/plasmid primase, P4 family [Alsobacter sp. KACC 23698]|uniref:Phage/plasmid primase, P4 family n=1 Tax=Alsobacter sp. KACC 23698 TaxID=3149229 RepID=A0AAU7JDR1_9HYPH
MADRHAPPSLSPPMPFAPDVEVFSDARPELVTQDGVAQVFTRRFKDLLRYCFSRGAWFEWDGTSWRVDRTDSALQHARDIARDRSRSCHGAEIRQARSLAFAKGVEKLARGAMKATAADWDVDPFLLGTPGGTVDLRTGVLRSANPQDGITKITLVEPAPTADCPRWTEFLHEALGGDAEVIRFLQQFSGYCLTGVTREQTLLFLHGPGGNGKSVFQEVLMSILHEYAATAPMTAFTTSAHDKHPTELAMLHGPRLVTASETEFGRAWDEARIKQLTGGDRIRARFMREDFFEFMPKFKLIFAGNHQPRLTVVDNAARRRVAMVPFVVTPKDVDHLLTEKLKHEAPGILRWMIDGALDWQANGLLRPACIADATETYFADQDVFGSWLAECCDTGDDAYWASSLELRMSYERYSEAGVSQKNFASQLQSRGFAPYRTGDARGFQGIQLKRQP